MSATKFIDELQRRRLLPDPQMDRLRDSLAGHDHPQSAQALASFLVEKEQLSEEQAANVLRGLSQSGIDLNAVDGPDPRREFYVPADDDEDEIRLVPLDEDFGSPNQTGAADDELPILGAKSPAEVPLSGWSIAPQVSELPEPELDTEEVHIIDKRASARVEEEPPKAAPPTPNRTTALRRTAKDRAKAKAKAAKARKRWDSPLILAGGGGLVFLILLGGTLWWLLGRESGDQVLGRADQALKSGQYVAAIDQYAHFLKDFPGHPEHSRARVQLAMVRIRQPTESKDFAAAVISAENELKAVEDEKAFKELDVHGELAALLPQIAQGLADQADKANPTSDDAKKFSDLAGQAIALYNNAAYVPKSLRDEAKLASVQDTLDHAVRRKLSQLALGEGLKAMLQAVADGKPIAAYTVHRKLLKEHPELTGEPALAGAIQKATAVEQAAVRYVKENAAAETSERPMPWRAALAVANRRLKPATPAAAAGATACIRVNGAVYAMDVASGRLLWRRHVGFGTSATPILIGPDVLIVDPAHNELWRLEAASGRLVWRQAIGQRIAELLVAGNVVLAPTDSGRLYAIDLESGERTGYLQFGQPLRVAPAIDRQKTRIYFPGDEACLYTVSLADMKCIGVRYLGHSPGSIRVSLAPVMDKVALVENEGVETSRLRLMALDEKGAIGKSIADRRLNGLVSMPPIVTGRGMIVVTDRGQIEVYDIASGAGAKPLSVLATREANSTQPLVR